MTKHQDYNGKYCPHRTLDMGWQRFLNMVKSYMGEEEKKVTYEEFKKFMEQYEKDQAQKAAGDWAEKAISYCRERKFLSGDAPNGNMRPKSYATREELAQVLINYDQKK